jgi:hypothetical protein
MNGQMHWARHFGGKAVSGFLVGLGILLMVLTQFLLTRLSTAGFIVGMCLVVAGIIKSVIRHMIRQKNH